MADEDATAQEALLTFSDEYEELCSHK